MNHKVFATNNEMPSQTSSEQQDEAADRPGSTAVGSDINSLERILLNHPTLAAQLATLTSEEKVALMLHWMAQIKCEQLQTLIAFGQQKLASVLDSSPPPEQRKTSLVLKKDYTYQEQGLSEPTQYYVYLRRRKPKLDRYIGTLFYVPQGCTLSYKVDAEGRVLFYPPHNLFRLKDPQNPSVVRTVRLLCLEPPPPDYTFTKQQHDSPQMFLHLEYLDPLTHQLLRQECYPFPACMYEGGPLDRYRWEVSIGSVPAAAIEKNPSAAAAENSSPGWTADTPRRIPENSRRSTQFFLANPEQSPLILERMRLWVSWSERAMPQSRWEIVQLDQVQSDQGNRTNRTNQTNRTNSINQTYALVHSDSRRTILSCQFDRAAVRFNHSLPVVMQWFQDLGLAVSQTRNQRQYPAAQLKLARGLLIDMSLAQTDPLVVLKQLFGVSFTKTASLSE